MRLGSKSGSRLRTAILVGGCLAAGTVAGPGLATAAIRKAQDVFVTNTAADPVPVAPQGTTQVAGTVTVANQPVPPAPQAQPTPIQIRIPSGPVTHDDPTDTQTLFTVPAGKILTVEYAEVYFSAPADAYNADLHVGCVGPGQPDGPIDETGYHLPEIEGSNLQRIFGGPMKLLVPPGACLRSHVTVVNTFIGPGNTLFINGSITGFLSDAPAS